MPFAEMATRLAASRLGVDATWISRDGGPSVAVRLVFRRPEAGYGGGASVPRSVARSATVMLPSSALPGPPQAGDLLAFEDIGYTVQSVEADARAGGYNLTLRVS